MEKFVLIIPKLSLLPLLVWSTPSYALPVYPFNFALNNVDVMSVWVIVIDVSRVTHLGQGWPADLAVRNQFQETEIFSVINVFHCKQPFIITLPLS